jgi:hypothetical protein
MEATMVDMINGGGGTEGGSSTQHDATQGGTQAAPISIDEAPLFKEEQPQVTKGASHRTGNFNELEDVCLREAWMEVRQDPICGAQQRGCTSLKRTKLPGLGAPVSVLPVVIAGPTLVLAFSFSHLYVCLVLICMSFWQQVGKNAGGHGGT